MITPEQIPQFTGDLAQLEADYAALKTDAGHVRDAGADVHSRFQGLSAYYRAPEAEQLFATTKPVKDRADGFADDLEKVSGALSSYATEIRPLVDRLKQLKAEATAFVASVKDDDEWEYDEDKVGEHNQLRDDITATVAAFWAAERTCHNKITALWGGTQMVAGDGSDRKDQYGFSAEDMKNAKLPWGDPVEEKHHWYEVGHWVKSFVWDGLIVDGIWGTIKGLGTLVGFGGWEAMGQAWKGLAQLATGLVLSSLPGVSAAFWLLPDDKLPSWIRDSRTAMKETGKALVAWDQWGKNPARAAGAVTFNVLTTVFTGGAGGAVSGAGKAGAVAKVLGTTAKVIDPMTYIAKGAGAGLSKIGDISAALKGVGNIEIPRLPDNAITLPEGTVRLPEGTVRLPEGAAIPTGGIRIPEGGAVTLPEGTALPPGAVDLGNGAVKLPEGTPVPAGAVELPEGAVKLPDDAPVLPEGTVKLPTEDGAPARYYDPEGNILDEGGNVIQKSDDGPGDVVDQPGVPRDGADLPRVDSPVREPAMAGAATGTADNAGQHIRLGNALDDLGDIGRTGDDATPPTGTTDDLPGGTANNLPGGTAGNLPTNSLDNATPVTGTGDNLPGGRTDDLGTGGTHAEGPGTGGGHTDGPGTGGGPLDPPSGGAVLPGGLDDAARGSDDAARHAAEAARREEYEAARQKPADERTPAERAAITREHVRLANEDPVWRAEHYDKWGPGKRNNAEEMVDGQLLPKLVEKPGGGWMAADAMPYANPDRFHLTPLDRGRSTVPAENLGHLDDVSAKRFAGMQLTDAQKTFDATPTDEAAEALAKAQDHFNATVGEGVGNNSKLGEALGEEAARRHMLMQKEFDGAREITDLPETANGSKRFDQLWRDKDGNLIIVEAKGPNARLDWRQGNGVQDSGTMVKQGTIEYVRTIVADMEERALFSPNDAKYAAEIRAAIENKSLRYVLVQAAENTGKYAGAQLQHFKIF
ncbi:hypothetical protein [Streptomyces chromofuscus]|uniref:Uncharacterized protein n=1 Tax=Streptomyces chromofuscus TaxID=42881 RepID=A0A7M2TJ80_STRCW|nr:hypothetical protein [Streptomyces chromofuscus]QOV47738.1 hypothetical protein IPT68_23480 [Streptomyces chromofuscus]GGS90517.1 hypothetical protein GCM10010254_08000 [Streptomyces chromofuscus]